MAGDEQALKDAKIAVRLDLSEARRALDDIEIPEGRSTPGGRPPSPGKVDQKERRKDERRSPQIVTTGGKAVGLLKTFVSGVVAIKVLQLLPDMIDARLETLGMDDVGRAALEKAKKFFGDPARSTRAAAQAAAAFTSGEAEFVGTMRGQLLAQQALFGTVNLSHANSVARIQATVRKQQSSLRALRSNAETRIAARAALGTGDALKRLIFNAVTGR